jgi:hypothetical protein
MVTLIVNGKSIDKSIVRQFSTIVIGNGNSLTDLCDLLIIISMLMKFIFSSYYYSISAENVINLCMKNIQMIFIDQHLDDVQTDSL